MLIVVSAGIVTLGPSEDHDEAGAGGFQEPTGKAVATVVVDALPTLKFQSDEFTTQAGINEIEYLDKGGAHTLAFQEPELAGFLLEVPPDDSSKVELEKGKYKIYCTVPGHAAAGMHATLVVE